jgi:hypothetical protein
VALRLTQDFGEHDAAEAQRLLRGRTRSEHALAMLEATAVPLGAAAMANRSKPQPKRDQCAG